MPFENSLLLLNVQRFLKLNCDFSKPVLLAFSGGPDSTCLFHLLLTCRQKTPFDLQIAHIDHGWREESSKEARALKLQCEALGLPFHLKTLDPSKIKGNLEAECREERLRFFREICQKQKCQAVFLAHHGDDQGETVLKKILEGSALPHFAGLQAITSLNELTLWRPLLEFSKKQIEAWLLENRLSSIADQTNLDSRFLRGRLRTTVMPWLSHHFGKEVNRSLCRVAQEAAELKEFLDQRLQPWMDQVNHGVFGSFLDLRTHSPSSRFEIRHVIQRFCEQGNQMVSRSLANTATELILQGAGDKVMMMGKMMLYIDRKRLFFLPLEENDPNPSLQFSHEQQSWGKWMMIERSTTDFSTTSSWEDAWKGKCEVVLPKGNYWLGAAQMNARYGIKNSISKWWTKYKIPAFLRKKVPVLWSQEGIIHEFLTGKTRVKQDPSLPLIRIALVYTNEPTGFSRVKNVESETVV